MLDNRKVVTWKFKCSDFEWQFLCIIRLTAEPNLILSFNIKLKGCRLADDALNRDYDDTHLRDLPHRPWHIDSFLLVFHFDYYASPMLFDINIGRLFLSLSSVAVLVAFGSTTLSYFGFRRRANMHVEPPLLYQREWKPIFLLLLLFMHPLPCFAPRYFSRLLWLQC